MSELESVGETAIGEGVRNRKMFRIRMEENQA